MKHYLFEDLETGEQFIVGGYGLGLAYEEAKQWFSEPNFLGELTEAEAECSGLDEF